MRNYPLIAQSNINATTLISIKLSVPILVLLMAVYPLLPLVYVFSSNHENFYPLTLLSLWSFFMILAILAIFVVSFSLFVRRDINFSQSSMIFLFLFLTAMAISALFSKYQSFVWLGNPIFMTGFMPHIGFAAVFLLAREAVLTRRIDIEYIIRIWLLSATIISLLGLLQYLGLILLSFRGVEIFEPKASYSTFINPNDLGSYLVMAFPFAAHFFLKSNSMMTLLMVALIYGATLTSMTRGAWIGLFAGLVIFFLLYPQKRNFKKLIIIMLLVTISLLPFNDWRLYHRINTFSTETEKALEGDPTTGASRFLLWQEGIRALPQSLVIGTGPDTHFYVSPEKFTEGFRKPGTASKAHNLYLEYTVTIGLPGLLFFLLFIYSIIVKTNIQNALHITFLSMVIIHLVRGLFLVDVIQVYPLFWVLLGFYSSLTHKANSIHYEK